MAHLVGRDLALRHTEKNGKIHDTVHRVWDVDLFLRAQMANAAAEGGTVALLPAPSPRKRSKK